MSDPNPIGDLNRNAPLVRGRSSNRGPIIFGIVLCVFAVFLFLTLQARQDARTVALGIDTNRDAGRYGTPAPELVIPSDEVFDYAEDRAVGRYQNPGDVSLSSPQRADGNAQGPRPVINRPSRPAPVIPQRYAPPNATGPAQPAMLNRPVAPRAERSLGQVSDDERVYAARLANPASTVPKGTIIPAVLETAIDSTQTGYARAVVSEDVYAFSGESVLIPKGSRIVGEYKANLARGQKRAMVEWQRLISPDGVIVAID